MKVGNMFGWTFNISLMNSHLVIHNLTFMWKPLKYLMKSGQVMAVSDIHCNLSLILEARAILDASTDKI